MSVALDTPWKDSAARDLERDEKRDAVLRIAAQIFCEKGVRKASLDEIADRLNVTKPTLYHYFRNKDDIVAQCAMMGLRLIDDAIADADKQGVSALDRLRAALRRYAEVMMMDFGMCVIRIAETDLSPAGRAEFRTQKRKIDRRIRELVQDCVTEGAIVTTDVRMAVFMLAGSLNWIARWYDPSGAQSPEAISHFVVEGLIQGLAPRAPTKN